MTITVRIPTQLHRLTCGQTELVGHGHTVAEVLDDLDNTCPGICETIVDEHGLRRYVNVYVGENDIRFLDGVRTELRSGDVMTILLTIAGG